MKTLNVKDFGAVGDGVTDDTQALANAFIMAMGEEETTVLMPTGQYRITSDLTIPPNARLEGASIIADGADVTLVGPVEWEPVQIKGKGK